MPAKPLPSPDCSSGKCSCIPACETQSSRVDAFLNSSRSSPPEPSHTPPNGTLWFCQGCASIRKSPKPHCGTRIILIDKNEIERDKIGRIVKVTCATDLRLFKRTKQDVEMMVEMKEIDERLEGVKQKFGLR